MSLKPQNKFLSMDQKDVANLNSVIARAYQTRVESLHKREGTAVASYIYQSCEHGEVNLSANGSATVEQSFGFKEKQNKIIFASAHAISNLVTAHVTDVTATGITILMQNASAGGDISDVTSASIKIFYEVWGSNP